MKRRLFNAVSVISLLLLCAAVVLWARGFWISDTFIIARWHIETESATGRFIYLGSDCSQFSVTYRWQHSALSPAEFSMLQQKPPSMLQWDHGTNPTSRFELWSADRGEWAWERAGFTYRTSDDRVPKRVGLFDRAFAAPFWFVFALCGIAPACQVVAFRRAGRQRHRELAGLCAVCGYDQRATKARCPECGSPNQNAKQPLPGETSLPSPTARS